MSFLDLPLGLASFLFCAFCAFSRRIHSLCYCFRFFLTGFVAMAFCALLTGFFAAVRTFSLTIFLAGVLGTFFTILFLAAFFADLADGRPAGFADLVAATAAGACTGLASAPSISRQPLASRTAIIADKMSFQV